METTKLVSEGRLDADDITRYRRRGFLRVQNMFSRQEALEFRQHALDYAQHHDSLHQGGIFTQLVNAWRHDEAMRALTLHLTHRGVRALAGGRRFAFVARSDFD